MFGNTGQLLSLFEIILNNFAREGFTAALEFFAAVAFANICQKFAAAFTTGTPESEVTHMRLVKLQPTQV